MNDSNNNPVIIKKSKKSGGGHHGGAWKVAYADFVTAMMALFIVLWILAQSDEIKAGVAGYFSDPIGFSTTGKGTSIIGTENNSMVEAEFLRRLAEKEKEKSLLTKMGEEIIDGISKLPGFESIKDQLKVEIIEEGLRIEMLESADDIFFEIGTAVLKKNAVILLNKIGEQLNTLPNKIVIEGHTDSRPFINGRGNYSNYELSADRANSARRALLDGGLNDSLLDGIRGYADKRLRNKHDSYDTVNRRISIIVKYSM